ncbi:unnamed protein product [Ceutorhynchus assimilis]|uniref:Kinesin-like protein n=1 Tax=Ceutorhynchus assimilis TaxID=467358 RepID=A0A9N9MWM5_9CUCU|nr:unnamed protein product [Ceutorhynchus assimilis]
MAEASKKESENIKVFIRLKPLVSPEQPSNISSFGDIFLEVCRGNVAKVFQYNKILDGNATQMDVYENVASSLVDKVLKGYNGTIFAYGQSGTGKTFTIFGDNQSKGIIPNVFLHIFKQISLAKETSSYLVTVTFMEIYNEQIRDLLNNNKKKLEIRERADLGVYVKHLTGINVESIEQVYDIISNGTKNRALGATNLNQHSSRSHAIFTIYLEAKHQDGSTNIGKLNLVDLAGSERVSKSLATGDCLKEAVNINLSLSTLGKVILALIEKNAHIPYRNSKLTRLLQDSLGGTSLTSMIATISLSQANIEETVSTLKYADVAQHVKNSVKKNESNKSVLKDFEDKIKMLQEELEKLNSNPVKKKTSKVDIQLEEIENNKKMLQNQLLSLQSKILIGGENLLEKAQLQNELLHYRASKINVLDTSQKQLEETLEAKIQEKSKFERQSMSLLEQDALLDIQIEEAERKICEANEKLFKNETKYQKEISELLLKNKRLAKEQGEADFIINKTIPKAYLETIKSKIVWDEEFNKHALKDVAYCGNNMRRIDMDFARKEVKVPLKNPYKAYPKRND